LDSLFLIKTTPSKKRISSISCITSTTRSSYLWGLFFNVSAQKCFNKTTGLVRYSRLWL